MANYRKIKFNQLSKADLIFSTPLGSAISATIRAATSFIINITNHSKLIVIFSLFFLVLIFSGCGGIYKSGFVPVPAQPVSGPIEIGPEWVEIIPPAPLKPYGTLQYLVIGYHEYDKNDYSAGRKGEILNLADGRKTRIEAFLYDDRGESYELQITGTGGVGGGISLNRKLKMEVVDGKPEYTLPDFPNDRTYTKLKIQSEIPLKCDRVEWKGSSPK